jgi:exopolysaccharide production protein ExoQ
MYQAIARRPLAPGVFAPALTRVPMSRIERVFHILAMITQFGAIVPLFLYFTGDPNADTAVGQSAPIDTLMMGMILVVSLVMGLRYRDNIIRALPALTPVMAFLALCLLSALWSDYPMITLRRSGTAITTALWGAYLASRFSLRDIIILVAQSIGIIAVASLIVTVLFPGIGIDTLLDSSLSGTPGWKGILSDKNSLGIVMATGAVSMLYLLVSPGGRRRDRVYWFVGLVLCAALLYFSQSRTSWIAALIGVVACVVGRGMYRRPAIGLVALSWIVLLGVPAVLFIMSDLGAFTALVGKNATLTGRVELWRVVLPYGAEKPWLGYGYGAFWIAKSPLTQEIWNILNSYKPPHAHNGWIETYLELGLAGCFIVAVQMVQILFNAVRGSIGGRDVDAPYMLLIVVMMLLFNLVEADLIRAPALFWPFLIIGPVAMAKVMRQPRKVVMAGEPRRVGPPTLGWTVPAARLNAPPPLKARVRVAPVGRLARPIVTPV